MQTIGTDIEAAVLARACSVHCISHSSGDAGNDQTRHLQVPFEPDYRQLGGLIGADRLRGIQTSIQQQQADWVSALCIIAVGVPSLACTTACLSCSAHCSMAWYMLSPCLVPCILFHSPALADG